MAAICDGTPRPEGGYTARAAKGARASADWYEAQVPGPGKQFSASLRDAERLALTNPQGFHQIVGLPGIRAVVVRRFPFRLLYALRGDGILVVAVAHTARKPDRFFSP